VGLAAELSTDWFGTYGGTGNDEATASCFDSAGNYYIAGNFKGILDIDNQTLDSGTHSVIFIAKLNSEGQLLWAKQSTGSAPNTCVAYVKSICADASGNLYICGEFKGKMGFGIGTALNAGSSDDIFVAKLNPTGTFAWAKIAGTSGVDDIANSICLGTDDSLVLCGDFSGAADLFGMPATSSGSTDIFVAKLNPMNGERLELSTFGSSDTNTANSICATPNGNYAMCGTSTGTIVFGSTTLTALDKEAYVCALDTNLEPLWAISSDGIGIQEGDTICANSNSIFISGRYTSAVSFDNPSNSLPNIGTAIFAAKLDLSGNFVWLKSLGRTTTYSASTSSYVNTNAELYLAGSFADSLGTLISSGSSDGYILKLSSDGNYLWKHALGGTFNDSTNSICGNSCGQVLCAGYFTSVNANIIENTPVNHGLKDLYAVVFSEPSSIIPASPQNLHIDMIAGALQLNWNTVTVSQTGSPLTVTGYQIYHSSTLLAEDFQLLDECSETSYDLSGEELSSDVRFYKVIAVQ